MKIFAKSDVGLIRANNQDSFKYCFHGECDLLAIVCDGIGGSKAGDVASLMCVEYLIEKFNRHPIFTSEDDIYAWIKKNIDGANTSIFKCSLENSDYQGMGTTCVGLLISEFGHYVINVGDSRCYGIYPDKSMKCLTVDHNIYNDLIRFHHATKEEANMSVYRDYLTRSIGTKETTEHEVFKIDDKPSLYLLCSDGVHGYMSDEIIHYTLANDVFTLEEKVNSLIQSSLKIGGYDNVTALIVDGEDHE